MNKQKTLDSRQHILIYTRNILIPFLWTDTINIGCVTLNNIKPQVRLCSCCLLILCIHKKDSLFASCVLYPIPHNILFRSMIKNAATILLFPIFVHRSSESQNRGDRNNNMLMKSKWKFATWMPGDTFLLFCSHSRYGLWDWEEE